MDLLVFIKYSDIYPDQSESIEDVVGRISQAKAIKVAAEYSKRLRLGEIYPYKILIQLVSGLPPTEQDYVDEMILKYLIKTNLPVQSIACCSQYTALRFIQYVLKHSPVTDDFSDLTDTECVDIFKAFLLCNEIEDGFQKKILETTSKYPELPPELDKIVAAFLSRVGFEGSNNFAIQIYKAIKLFSYIEANPEFYPCVDEFYSYLEVEDWRQYLREGLGVIKSLLDSNNGSTSSSLLLPPEYMYLSKYLDRMVINKSDNIRDIDIADDPTALRYNPLYKVEAGHYIIMDQNLFVDKLYQGIYFDLREVLKSYDKQNKTKKADDFKRKYGEDFSEQGLFIPLMDECLSGRKGVKMATPPGSDPKENRIGNWDYYYREGNNLLLFEYKDALLRSDKKFTHDFDLIIEEVSKKFFSELYDPDAKKKGGTQILSRLAVLIKNNGYGFDNFVEQGVSTTDINVYPVIVFSDVSVDFTGLNFLFNIYFEQRLNSIGSIPFKNAPVLVFIHIDTLIVYRDAFKDGRLLLQELIDEYSNLIRPDYDMGQWVGYFHYNYPPQWMTFTEFVDMYTRKHNIRPSYELLKQEVRQLFEEQS